MQVCGCVQEAYVLVHVADKLRRETLDVLEHAHGPLESLVSPGAEHWIVDHHAIDKLVVVGIAYFIFKHLAIDLAQNILKTAKGK